MIDWGLPPYLEQLRRTRRWLERIKNQDRAQQEYLDDLYAFFQSCWHLKEWVKNDRTLEGKGKGIAAEVESRQGPWVKIQICADIANSTKHLERDPGRRTFKDASVAGANVVLVVGDSVAWHYFVRHNGGTSNALEVAGAAVREWGELLTKHGLPIE